MKRWWMSFFFPGEDYRPIKWPPTKGILGFWCTGETFDEPPRITLCILAESETEESAKDLLLECWPESKNAEWRFCDERDTDWKPSDRFPIPSWSSLYEYDK